MDNSVERKVRVLQVQNNYNISESDLAEQIVKGLPPERFSVTTAFLKKKPAPGDPVSCAQHAVYFDFKSAELKGVRRFVALYRLYQFCRKEQFDVVICHRFKPTHIFLLLNRLLGFQRCICVTHGLGDYDRRYRQKVVGRWLTDNWCFVGVSQAVREDLISHCPSLNPENTVVINNAIDIERAQSLQLSRVQARVELGLANDVFVFGTIGRLVPVKGHSDLIKAAALLKERYPHMQVVIIGGGRDQDALTKQIAEAGLEQTVILAGWKDNALRYVKAFDVFVLPSLSEGLPLSLLEAMSGAVPTIGSNIPQIRAVIDGLGLLAPPQDPEALAKTMEEYLALDEGEIRQRGTAHLQALLTKHNINDYRTQYRLLIEKMGVSELK